MLTTTKRLLALAVVSASVATPGAVVASQASAEAPPPSGGTQVQSSQSAFGGWGWHRHCRRWNAHWRCWYR
jgi:hypothetical protein